MKECLADDESPLTERFTEHDLRAATDTQADEAGRDAQAFLGHHDRKTTEICLRSRKPTVVKPLR